MVTSTSISQHGAVIGSPLPKRTDFGPIVAARHSQPQSAALWPVFFLATTHYFSREYFQVLIATCLPTLQGWEAELACAPQV